MNSNYCYRVNNSIRLCICYFYCSGNIPDDAVRLHTHTHTHKHTYTQIHTHTHTHTLACTGTHTPARPHTHTHTHTLTMCTHLVHAYRHTHSHTHSLTLTHAHSRLLAKSQKPVSALLTLLLLMSHLQPVSAQKGAVGIDNRCVFFPLSRDSSRFSISVSVSFTLNVSLYLCT